MLYLNTFGMLFSEANNRLLEADMIYKYEHHQKAVEKYIEQVKDQKGVLAVILSGSLSREWEKENSDIDLYLVLDDMVYEENNKTMEYCCTDYNICEYDQGYIDAKIISLQFLKEAAVHGSEPTRASFIGSNVVYTKDLEINNIVKNIPVFQEENWEARLQSFYSQVLVWGKYFYKESIKGQNLFLETRALNEMVLFSARYVLCLNKVLFPGYKSLFKALGECEIMPENFIDISNSLLREADLNKVKEYVKMMKNFAAPRNFDHGKTISIFIKDSEWNWLNGNPSIEDR